MNKKWILTLIVGLLVLAACTSPQIQLTPSAVMNSTSQAGVPNPSSVYCEQQGNRLEIRTAADGGVDPYRSQDWQNPENRPLYEEL